jgi:hypothetical protein
MKLDQAVYCVDWNSDDDYVVCGSGRMLYIKPLKVGFLDTSLARERYRGRLMIMGV